MPSGRRSPELRRALDWVALRRSDGAGGPQPLLQELRAGYDGSPYLGAMPADVGLERADANGVVHWLTPPGSCRTGTVVYLHGGGYVLGSLASHGELAARIGRASGTRVLFPEYRLAPEHPFPAALDDALAAWRWARGQGVEAEASALVGDSAGGGLALALLVALRDAGEPLPAAAVLMSPWTDLTLSGESARSRTGEDPILTPAMLSHFADLYLAGADPSAPAASPLLADLTGLPETLVQVGTAEILLSDSERLVAELRRCGCRVTFDVAEGLPHGYHRMATTPEAAGATDRIGGFIRSVLGT